LFKEDGLLQDWPAAVAGKVPPEFLQRGRLAALKEELAEAE
jgi:hypothetical protein